MNQLQKGATRQNIVNYFVSENENHNNFEKTRWAKSLALRGHTVMPELVFESNSVPGIYV